MELLLDHFKVDNEAYGGSQAWFRTAWMRLGGCAAQTACDVCVFFAKYYGMKYLYPFDEKNVTRKEYVTFSNIMRPYLKPRMGGIDTLEIYMDGFRKYIKDAKAGAASDKAPDCEADEEPAAADLQLVMEGLPGESSAAEAEEAIIKSLSKGFPVSCLILHHEDPAMDDYVWHWFLINGYRKRTAIDLHTKEGLADPAAQMGLADSYKKENCNDPAAQRGLAGSYKKENCSDPAAQKKDAGPSAQVRTVTYGKAEWVSLEKLWDTGREPKGGLVFFDLL